MISAMISINSIIIYQNFCVFKGENLIQIHNLVNFIIENNKKIGLQLRIEISARFSVNFQFRAELKKVTSRANLKILQLELWLKPARLGLITKN